MPRFYGPRDHEECPYCGATLIDSVCPCETDEDEWDFDDEDFEEEEEEEYDAAWESEARLRYMEGWG